MYNVRTEWSLVGRLVGAVRPVFLSGIGLDRSVYLWPEIVSGPALFEGPHRATIDAQRVPLTLRIAALLPQGQGRMFFAKKNKDEVIIT